MPPPSRRSTTRASRTASPPSRRARARPRRSRGGSTACIPSWCFASTSSYRARDCYSKIAEFSVYVERDHRGRRVGRQALAALIDESRKAGLHKLVSRIFPENVASRAACRAAGFREVGVYKEHGQLEGEWKDCVIVERLVG